MSAFRSSSGVQIPTSNPQTAAGPTTIDSAQFTVAKGAFEMSTAISRMEITPEAVAFPKNDKHFRLPAVDRAINLFELLASSESGLTLSELSRKLNMPKSTMHYLIYTLASRGYLQRTSNGRHSLGMRFADVASASTAELNLSVLATPYLRQISVQLNLTALLAVLRGAEAVIIAKVTSAQDAGGGAWVGRHIDLHCTAQGKALIAGLPDQELTKLLGGRELANFTPRTISSLSSLKSHLMEVRMNGYAVNDEEQVHGVRAVASPVFDPRGVVIAAVSVRGSTDQIPCSRLRDLGRDMICASRNIALHLFGPLTV
jgi:DNA-binding IclR family transcriptional regulator